MHKSVGIAGNNPSSVVRELKTEFEVSVDTDGQVYVEDASEAPVTTGSNLRIMPNGQLFAKDCVLSKAGIDKYSSMAVLGISSDKEYRIYRSEDELRKSIGDFNSIQLLSCHRMITPENPSKEYWAGVINNVYCEDGLLRGDVCIWDPKAIVEILSRTKCSLSCSFLCRYELVSGFFDGEEYDGFISDLKPNHVALVKEPRVKGAAVINDSLDEEKDMPTYDDDKKDEDVSQAVDSEEEVIEEIIESEDTLEALAGRMNMMATRLAALEAKVESMSVESVEPESESESEEEAEAEDEDEDDEDEEEREGVASDSNPSLATAKSAVSRYVNVSNLTDTKDVYISGLKALGVEHTSFKDTDSLKAAFGLADTYAGRRAPSRHTPLSTYDKEVKSVLDTYFS